MGKLIKKYRVNYRFGLLLNYIFSFIIYLGGEIMKKFFKGTNDNMFKAIFTPKKNRELLKEFLKRSLKEVTGINLDNLIILSSEVAKTNINVKGKTLDILAETKDNILNIELNNSYYPSLHNRNAAYIFSKYAEEVKVSHSYKKMKTFIQINFTKGLTNNLPSLEIYTLNGKKSHKKYIDNLIILEFNIDKIKDECYNGDREFNFVAALDLEGKELDQICKGDKYMELFEKEVKRLNKDQKFTEFMSAEEEEKKLTNTLIEEAKDLGIEEGKTFGAEEATVKIAKNLLKQNVPLDAISNATGLSLDEIEALK